MNNLFITLKVINEKGRMIRKVGSSKIRRVYCFLQANKFKDCVFNLSVRYGRPEEINEGLYKTKKDLILAIRAFTENP